MTENSVRYRGWLVVVACFTMTFFGFGFGFYGHSVYLAALTIGEDRITLGISVATVSTAVTVYYLAAAVIMVFISDLVAKLGPRLFAVIGAAMMGVSLFLIAHIRSATDLFVAYLAMAPAFAMLTNAAVANIVGLWFIDKRGLAMSLALTGGGAGGLVIVPTLVWLCGKLSFPTALQIIAGITMPVLLLAIVLCIRRPTQEEARVSVTGDSAATNTGPITRRSALASAHYWTIAAPLMLAIMVQVALSCIRSPSCIPCLGGKAPASLCF
jgi:MFS family permease